MTVWAQQFLNRYLDRTGLGIGMEWRFQRGTYPGMFNATGKSHGEGVRVCYPAGHLPTLVRLLAGLETVNSGCPFREIKLGRVLKERDPPLVHFLGDPAFMPDMAMAAALIKRGEDPLDLRRAVAHHGEPRAVLLVRVEIGRSIASTDVGQSCSTRVESPDRLKQRIWLRHAFGRVVCRRFVWASRESLHPRGEQPRLPARNDALLQVGGTL